MQNQLRDDDAKLTVVQNESESLQLRVDDLVDPKAPERIERLETEIAGVQEELKSLQTQVDKWIGHEAEFQKLDITRKRKDRKFRRLTTSTFL